MIPRYSLCLSPAGEYFLPTTRIFSSRCFTGVFFRSYCSEICQGISIARDGEQVRIRRFYISASLLRDNLESLPQTGTTLCIYVACQRYRPPFELEILIWKSNRLEHVFTRISPSGSEDRRWSDSSLCTRLLKTRRARIYQLDPNGARVQRIALIHEITRTSRSCNQIRLPFSPSRNYIPGNMNLFFSFLLPFYDYLFLCVPWWIFW